jgi:carbon monoxide dehydrogenase subunit G
MIAIQLQTEIEAPPEVVFDLLADHSKHPLFDPYMLEARLTTERPIRKGSRGVTVGEFRGRRVENVVYYDAYDRPEYVSGGTSSGTVEATNSVRFSPSESGTEVDFRMEVRFKGPMRLLEPFMRSVLVRQKTETLDALKDYVKGHPVP